MPRWFSIDGFGGPEEPARTPQEKWAAIILAVFVLAMGIVYSGERSKRAAAQVKSPTQSVDTRPQNHLKGSTSPYLLEHSHNPVNWYPWGPEALALARSQNRPIFLSVGYSSCHWCHVMEREDFENNSIAQIMNANFVCIKVDREERPDIDEQYQTAVQLITGAGGWPMSVWLTPDLKPFHAGTYIPPTEFESQLGKVASLWSSKRDAVLHQAELVSARMLQISRAMTAHAVGAIPADIDARATTAILLDFDKINGGFGDKPKFPEVPRLIYLLSRYRDSKRADILQSLTTTLDHMAQGGIRDQLDGGFHRYSTEATWTVPHFEKMLYDQALMADVYLEAGIYVPEANYKEVARGVLDFVLQDMTDPKTGGFYTSMDADSDGDEGRYYLWTRQQVKDVLGADADRFDKAYGVEADGSYKDDMNVLHQATPLTAAQQNDLSPLRTKLLKARSLRVHPNTDDKIVCGLNGLMIEALARGYSVTKDVRYRAAAEKAGEFIAATLIKPDGTLLREFRAGAVGSTPGFTEDYAYLTRGMLACYREFGDAKWLRRADLLVNAMSRLFWKRGDAECFASLGPEGAPVRAGANGEDNATPSINGIAALDLIELAGAPVGDKPRTSVEADRLRNQALQTVSSFQSMIVRAPGAFPTLLMANRLCGSKGSGGMASP